MHHLRSFDDPKLKQLVAVLKILPEGSFNRVIAFVDDELRTLLTEGKIYFPGTNPPPGLADDEE